MNVATELNKRRIKPPRGSDGMQSTINGSAKRGNGMIFFFFFFFFFLNRAYVDEIVWNKVKDPATASVSRVPNPPDQYKVANAPQLRIIDACDIERRSKPQSERSHMSAVHIRVNPNGFYLVFYAAVRVTRE